MRHSGCTGGHPNRRDLLRIGSLSYLGISLSDFLAAAQGGVNPKAKAESCILIWLQGGPPQMDTWDPKPSSTFKPIGTNVAGIQISELFPKMARQMDKVALIRSMHTEENNHPQAIHEVLTGHRVNAAMAFPSLGAIISKEKGPRGPVPMQVLATGTGNPSNNVLQAHFLGAEYDPMVVPDPNKGQAANGIGFTGNDIKKFNLTDLSIPQGLSVERIESRKTFLSKVDALYRGHNGRAEYASMDKFREQALSMILSPDVRKAFDVSSESEKLRDAYGRNALGQSALLARRLVEAGSRFVTANGYLGAGWDTHRANDEAMSARLAPTLDQTLSTLLADLKDRGLIDSTIVLVMGEFGRTAEVNPNGGRDHWCYCWSMLLAGGGIRGGQIIGSSDKNGAYPVDRPVSIGDAYATIYKAMGIDWGKEYMHPIGRPLKIANSIGDMTGEPISELL